MPMFELADLKTSARTAELGSLSDAARALRMPMIAKTKAAHENVLSKAVRRRYGEPNVAGHAILGGGCGRGWHRQS
jgi:hypothetical protein